MNVASATDLQVMSLSPLSRVWNSLYTTRKMGVRIYKLRIANFCKSQKLLSWFFHRNFTREKKFCLMSGFGFSLFSYCLYPPFLNEPEIRMSTITNFFKWQREGGANGNRNSDDNHDVVPSASTMKRIKSFLNCE